ncbi:hypothetical protein SAMN05421788_11015 [Filimonas lacunae]|uniref:Glycosyltransferase family 1 protein n=1 Tax=Filimonas lacunae TaxID=477680 RepID=A0A173M9Q8_9BACT|nr:transporter [Filimonas lacunae]BAV04284.1 hypothetical protein FLA_0270 [Filimonas lacunae]SIT30896.1 hypothetical protein SAMN05421788_11015 [Filimonas lacunae]
MRILYITNPHEDYLADAVFHGFRTLFGSDCVDFPRCDVMYKNCPDYVKKNVRGNGFSLYSGLLDDIEVDRFNIPEKVRNNYFDLIVFSNIQRQFGLFYQFRPYLHKKNTVILDGDDTIHPFPARGFWWRRPYYWMIPKAHKQFLYFKREWTPDTRFSLLAQKLPAFIKKRVPQSANLRRVSFGFPEEKIVTTLPAKQKDFPVHVVDSELSARLPNTHTSYAFESEKEYYNDLQQSRFGITTKRGGWDCLRHYEIAANGAVMCFKQLQAKPANCAPHGLTGSNTIHYSHADDLLGKVAALSEQEYTQLQLNSLEWIKTKTTVKIAEGILEEIKKIK